MLKQKLKSSQLLLSIFGLIFLFSLSSGGNAISADNTSGQNAITSYNSSTNIVQGKIVGLKSGSKGSVEILTLKTINQMLGVVVQPNQSTVALTPSKSGAQQVYVATSGQYYVLVSNQNGYIKVGAPISISSLPGIGMEANSNQSKIIGKAAQAFDSKSPLVGSAILASSVSSTSLKVGYIPVNIAVANNPLKSSSLIPSNIQNKANSIAGKPVSPTKIYISALILIAAIITAIIFFINSLRRTFNSDSESTSKFKGFIIATFTGLLVFAAGVSAVYLILKL